jgi:hypothetical protein
VRAVYAANRIGAGPSWLPRRADAVPHRPDVLDRQLELASRRDPAAEEAPAVTTWSRLLCAA